MFSWRGFEQRFIALFCFLMQEREACSLSPFSPFFLSFKENNKSPFGE